MTGPGERGLSVVEVMVALVILTAGLLVLATGSLFVTRDLVRSRLATRATSMAQARLDDLRARAAATLPPCQSVQFTGSASPVVANGVSITWSVPAAGPVRLVRVVTSYGTGAGRFSTDTLLGSIGC